VSTSWEPSARQRAGETVEREVAEAHVAQVAHAGRELAEYRGGDAALERREDEPLDPVRQPVRREPHDRPERGVPHADREGFGAESRPTARGAGERLLVLPQKHADVLLVALALERPEEREHADKASRLLIQQETALRRGDLVPGLLPGDAARAGHVAQQAPAPDVARLGPWVDRAVRQAAGRLGDDERLVVLEHRAEAVAAGTGAGGVVEREQRRGEPGGGGAAPEAVRGAREIEDLGAGEHAREALAFAKREGEGVGEAGLLRRGHTEPVHHHQDIDAVEPEARGEGVEPEHGRGIPVA
jgi:hypothetical protein